MPLLEPRDNVTVNLDDMKMIEPFQKGVSQRAQARTDLHDTIIALRCNGIDNCANHLPVNQKMLPKTFARNVPAHGRHLNPNRYVFSIACDLRSLRHFDSLLNRGKQAAGIGPSASGQFKRRTVIDRSADNRKAKSDVGSGTETRVLECR